MTSRDLLEKQIVLDAIHSEDTTVLASLLEMLTDNQVYQALSDGNQEHYDEPEVEPSDCTTIEIESERAVEVIASNLTIMIKHNDVGVSIDYRPLHDDEAEPFRADQVWFEDIPEGDFMCVNCGGGFFKSEIVTDDDGDDFCNSCK